jgi:hypothetical protein
MTKTDIYNQLKQAEYKLDIEATQALIWAEQSYYVDGHNDWTDRAERKQSEAMGMFKALKELLPDTSKLKLNEESVKLMWEYMNIRQELKEIKENLQKEAA